MLVVCMFACQKRFRINTKQISNLKKIIYTRQLEKEEFCTVFGLNFFFGVFAFPYITHI